MNKILITMIFVIFLFGCAGIPSDGPFKKISMSLLGEG